MKNVFYGIIVGIILQAHLYASQVHFTEQKEVSIDSKNKLKSNIIHILVNEQCENSFGGLVYTPQILKFDIESEPLKTAIKDAQDRKEPCILARVIVQKPDKSQAIRYYVAEGFNHWRFGRSIIPKSVAAPVNVNDPLEPQLHVEFVQYFEYNQESQVFVYRINSFDLIGSTFYNEYWRTWLNAYQNFHLLEKFHTYAWFGDIYFLGYGGVKKDYRQSEKYLKVAAEQNISVIAQLVAYFRLGLISLYEGAYLEARQYFEKAAATQLPYKDIKGLALYQLGMMSFEGKGTQKNDVEAKKYFDEIVCSKNSSLLKKVEAMKKHLAYVETQSKKKQPAFVGTQSNPLDEPLLFHL